MDFRNLFKKKPQPSSPYESLTWNQKLAAMNLMIVFGGSCSGQLHEIDKINHIMSVEGHEMGVSGKQVHSARSIFFDMNDMVNALDGADRHALEKLFWAFYCIISVGKSSQAVYLLLAVYDKLGFSEQECIAILERKTGRKLNNL